MNQRKTVLIADDDHEVVYALRRICRGLGLDVIAGFDGLDAGCNLFLESIEESQPDLIILDVDMPIVDGLTVCGDIVADGRFANTPIIILTGRSDMETIVTCEEYGATYLRKSIEVWERLEAKIADLLELETTEAHA